MPPLFDAVKWHQRCFHVIFNKNVYMIVCPTFSSVPCQTFISAFPLLCSRILHMLNNQNDLLSLTGKRRGPDREVGPFPFFYVLVIRGRFYHLAREETNSTIHSLPHTHTQKKGIPDIIVFVCWWAASCCCCRRPFHTIHTGQCHRYIQCFWGVGWTALGNKQKHTQKKKKRG